MARSVEDLDPDAYPASPLAQALDRYHAAFGRHDLTLIGLTAAELEVAMALMAKAVDTETPVSDADLFPMLERDPPPSGVDV